MPTVKVKVDKKLYNLVTERLPGLGYASPEDFVRHAVELRFETPQINSPPLFSAE